MRTVLKPFGGYIIVVEMDYKSDDYLHRCWRVVEQWHCERLKMYAMKELNGVRTMIFKT